MATMSGPQPSGIVSSTTSSFGQFRLTTFVDAHPKPAASTAGANAPDPDHPSGSLPPQSTSMPTDNPSSDAPAPLLRPSPNPALPSPNASASPLAPTTSS
ncbi:hypothetical protein O988_08856, partial [Pseudogymnoascus sp. VKM F-3808]